MAKIKSRVRCLLISSPKGMDILQPIVKDVMAQMNVDFQLDLYSQNERKIIVRGRMSEKNFVEIIKSNDLLIVDLRNISMFSLFDIGVGRAIGKPILFLAENLFLEDYPDFIKQNNYIEYTKEEDLNRKLRVFFEEYVETPRKFTPRSLIDSDANNQIVVDLEKLAQRDFENLCFELLSRLGYKQIEWRIKDEFVDAATTLNKRDPDGFEYEEFWLISFAKEFMNDKMFDVFIHEPDYFVERIYRNLIDSNMIGKSNTALNREDVPIIILFVMRGNENYYKKAIRDLSKRDFNRRRHGQPFTIRVRWWDEQTITSLLQNNIQLLRKYFSTEAFTSSGVRLSYEQLYNQYVGMNAELQKTNEALISERSKIELLERDAAWKLLSFTAAHRLGNPMDAIDTELSNLKTAIDLKKSSEVIDEIIESMEIPIEKAKSIVSQFRNLSIAHEVKPELVNSEKLNEVLTYSAKPAIDKKLIVEFNFEQVPDISIDVQKLSECFDELVKNALHFVKGDQQKILIFKGLAKDSELPDKLDKSKKYVKITFLDNGCGVPNDKKKDIFKPFERTYIHGTGLGLAFCEIIIERHAGKIREIGKPDEGAIFDIFLPIIEEKL